MNRRRFLQGAAAMFAAPAIVRAESIMPIWTPPKDVITFAEVMTASRLTELQEAYMQQFRPDLNAYFIAVTAPICGALYQIGEVVQNEPTPARKQMFIEQADRAFKVQERELLNARSRRV